MASKSLTEAKFGLATISPWSLVLILGTLYVSEHTAPLSDPQIADNSNAGESDGEGETEEETVADLLKKVHDESIKIESEEDRELIYKLLSGAAEYLSNAKSIKNTSQFDPILGRVQTSYGWNRESYPDFTQAVSDYLVAAGYDEPRKLDTKEDRDWFQGIFEALAQATE